MNFTELMNQAAQNKQRAAKQHAQKRQDQAHTADTQGVSSAAVKAFLLKKEKEEKQQQAEQEKARKLRMQARLEQSLNSKKGRKKSTEDSTANDNSMGRERRKQVSRERDKKNISNNAHANRRQNEPPDSRGLRKKEASKRLEHQDRHTLNSAATRKGNKEVTKQPGPSIVRQRTSEVSKQGSTTKSKKSSTKAAAPLDFRELLAMAEMNKNHPPGATSGLFDKRTTGNAKNDHATHSEMESTRPSKAAAKDKKNSVRDSRNGKSADRGLDTGAKTSTKKGELATSLQSASKAKMQQAKRDGQINPRTPNHKVAADVPSRNLPKASNYDRYRAAAGPSWMRMQGRDPHLNRKRGRAMDEYDDDGMDDFIDDEGEDTDVSKHIREIFGYDRSRYNDTEEDCALMESNFSQIQREEARSGKIAKLEDEVEFLKEQAELKKQKQALMKQRKKK